MKMKKKTSNNNPKNSLPTGFEPVRAEPIGFQVQRLNHSAKAASLLKCRISYNSGVQKLLRLFSIVIELNRSTIKCHHHFRLFLINELFSSFFKY